MRKKLRWDRKGNEEKKRRNKREERERKEGEKGKKGGVEGSIRDKEKR